MLIVVGMPLLLLELALGQKLRLGAAQAWYKVRQWWNDGANLFPRCTRPWVASDTGPRWWPGSLAATTT